MFSLKTKFAAFGAAIALALLLGCAAIFILLRDTADIALDSGFAWPLVSIAAIAIIGSAWLSFFNGRRLVRMLQELNHSTARISQGDYTQPVQTLRRDELGDLQRTIDQMRQTLSETTITKNYLDNVLNSMADAVFVTSADGTIKITNASAQRLTGAREPELVGRNIAVLLHAADLDDRERLQRAREVGEAVLRTTSGQTIPVSFTGSTIETSAGTSSCARSQRGSVSRQRVSGPAPIRLSASRS